MKNGWQIKKIGDVCHVMTGGTPSKAKHDYFGGQIKWLVSGDIHQGEIFDCDGRITEAGMRNSNAKLLQVNSVMMALNGQGKTRGTVALLRTQATCNQSLVSIYPKEPDILLPEYLYANLHGRYQEIRQMTGDSGNDRRGLNMGLVKSIEIPIAPLPEQQRIVGILDESFKDITTAKANAEKNLQNAHALFQSHLQSVFSRRGAGWVNRALTETCEMFADGDWVESKDQSPEGIRLIQTGNVGKGLFKDRGDKARYISEATFKRLRCTEIFEGDCLISRLPDPVGRSCLLPDTGERMITAVDCTIVRFNAKQVMPAFFIYYSQSRDYLRSVDSETTGTTRNRISRSNLGQVAIPVAPLADQKRIIADLDSLSTETQRLESLYERKLAVLEALKQSLLHQAFSGHL